MGLREDILAAGALKREAVDMSEFDGWPEKIWVQELTATDRDALNASMLVQRGRQMGTDIANLRAKTLVQALIDEDGTKLFTTKDAAAIGAKGDKAIGKLFDKVQELSGMTEDAEAEIAGNSTAGETGSSPSDSLETSESQ